MTKKHQSDEDRALQEQRRRRQQSRAEADRPSLGDDDETPVEGLTVPRGEFDQREDTKPIEMIDRAHIGEGMAREQFARDMAAAQHRYDTDPSYRALWRMVRRERRASDQLATRVGNAAIAATVGPPQEFEGRLAALEREMASYGTVLRFVKWACGVVVPLILGGIVGTAIKIYSAGYAEGQLEVRVQTVERAVMELARLHGEPQLVLPSLLSPQKKGPAQ